LPNVTGRARDGARVPLWHNAAASRLVVQVVFVALVLAAYWWLAGNLITNLRRLDLATGFDFLDQSAGFAIPHSDFDSNDPISRAIVIGVRNTAAVAGVGLILATVVGVIVGTARLSQNWLIRRAAGAYVETLRNVPVLVVIIFFYTAVVLRLPPMSRAAEWGDFLILSNGGLAVPSLHNARGTNAFAWAVVLAVIMATVVWVWRTRLFDRTGVRANSLRWSAGTFVGLTVVAYLILRAPVGISLPVRTGPRIAGGIVLGPEYAALLIGLSAYTAAHIAEIVRGSVLAVSRGQSEAALALGLSNAQRLRLVVLPQALRFMIPPLSNQYLNLTKNSSLAIAIGFPEVTRIVRIAIGQGSPAPQAIALLMLIYLAFSLTLSLGTNLINRRLQLVTR
jgi:general L-amino acid transport system permease protein